jgi:hypothetical protein
VTGPVGERLDDFADPSGWSAVASGNAELAISADPGPSLRLDFDFHGGGGFVVARKAFSLVLPTSYALRLHVRGRAPANKLELKLVDPSGRNVWWFHRDAFEFPAERRLLRIPSREIEFAWGPAGGGAMRELGAIELAIAAGPGGRGTVWLEDLRLEDLDPKAPPRASASSALPGHGPERVLDGLPDTSWRSEPGSGAPWLSLDFGQEREYGALLVDWAPGAGARAFAVETSDDGRVWRTAWRASQAEGLRSYVYLPGGASRFLRVVLEEGEPGAGFGVVALGLWPYDASRTLDEFLHRVAADQRRGLHPRALLREQSHWTPLGIPERGRPPSLMNEEGGLEAVPGGFSLEPFLFGDGRLVTWADALVSQSLAGGWLPIPSSLWRADGLTLETSACAVGDPGAETVWVRHRVTNDGPAPRRLHLFLALRPYQVTPPWQAFRGFGGASPIRELAWSAGAVRVDGEVRLVPQEPPDGFGAAAFEQGGVTARLAAGELPPRDRVRDAFGQASGALRYDLELAPGASRDYHAAVPLGGDPHDTRRGDEALAAAARRWQDALPRVAFQVPETVRPAVDALRTAAAHILLCRDGPALQPGPRRYTRSWIRDAATMSAALLRLGCGDAVRDFLRWYAPYQREDGAVPCCVDRSGPDWLVEHDSHGELAFTVAEHFRLTRDRGLAAELWPAVRRAADHIQALRAQRLGPEFERGERSACHGLLPESASHEGYLAHPVHAYWDDFWALRGLGDAAELAASLGDPAEARRLATLRDALRESLYASIASTIARRDLRYVPGSVEWADFDPAATATAITTTDAAESLPAGALAYTFDEYLAGFRKRRRGEIDWANYTPYEIRIVGALLRLGRRADAHELLDFFLADRRPRAWNQWPEIAWRDPRSPGHLGDLPHAWIGAEYVLAVLALFAYERPADGALVVAAGVPAAWLDGGFELGVSDLATAHGTLGYTLRSRSEGSLELSFAPGLEPPPGGLVLRPPLPAPLREVIADGRAHGTFAADSATFERCPSTVLLRC